MGEKDDYDWMSLKDFLRDTVGLRQDDVFKVDVKESFSFFNTDAAVTDQILSTFTEFKVDGRFVNVEVSKNPGGGRRDRNRGGGGSRGSRNGSGSRGSRNGSGSENRGRNRSTFSGKRRDRNSSSSGKSENSGTRRSKSDFF